VIETAASAPQQWISIVAGVGIVLAVSEELVMRPIYADDGLLSWQVLQVGRPRALVPQVQGLVERLFRPRAYMELLVVKLVTALALVAVSLMNPDARIATGLLAVALLVQLLLMKRRSVYGLDGADQMYVVVFLGLAVYEFMPQGSLASAAGLIYIGAQTVLSYLIAGCVKIAGPSWRDGTAIGGIMTTKIYGNSAAAAVLQGRATLGLIACWLVITFEITFVAALFVDRRIMWVMLAAGVLFHAANTALMGLNSFFVAFVASYPAVAYVNELMHRLVF
jgi:hypothetical protein